MHVHRRQFVVGPRPSDLVPGWVTAHIPDVGYLSCSPELSVSTIKSTDGATWHLLGTALQTDASRSQPSDELDGVTSRTVEDTYQTWAGRWALIGAGRLHVDASGLLACFYGFKKASDGTMELWASSSLALLAELLDVDPNPVRPIKHGSGIDWYVGPESRFASIRQVLPTQILDILSGRILPRRPPTGSSPALSYDDLLDRLQSYLAEAVTQAANASDRLFLPLTAGYDSRLLLATARYAGVATTTYTNIYDHMGKPDRVVPPKLAEAAGFQHIEHHGEAYRPDLATLYDRHTNGNCVDRDRFYISHQYFEWCQPGDMILRGGGFEIGRCYYWDRFPEAHHRVAPPSGISVLEGFGERSPAPSLAKAMNEWIAWTDSEPHGVMDWRDRLYLDQRLGCWLSAVEQSLDLIDAGRFHAANSHFYMSHVLQVSPERRCRTCHQVDLIRRMAPELLRFPFNLIRRNFVHDAAQAGRKTLRTARRWRRNALKGPPA